MSMGDFSIFQSILKVINQEKQKPIWISFYDKDENTQWLQVD
jgi:hypothetical protein